MTTFDLQAILPFLLLGATVAVQLGLAAFARSQTLMALAGIMGLTASGVVALTGAGMGVSVDVTPLIHLDGIGNLALALSVFSAAAVSALFWQRSRALAHTGASADPVELHLLVSISATGAALVSVAGHLIAFVLGLEIAAVAYTAAVAWRRDDGGLSIEGAIKTLLMGAVGTAFVLFGGALAWLDTDSLAWNHLGQAGLVANLLMLTGLAIKLGAVPFHGWVTDAWHASTAPVALLLGTTAKIGVVGALLHLWPVGTSATHGALLVLAIGSMLGGALLGTAQSRVKRLLAASSIAHMGDMLLGVSLGTLEGSHAVLLYLLCYSLSLVAVFAAVEALADGEEADTIASLRGRASQKPLAAVCFTLGIASLAGVPFTAGFAGKLALLIAAIHAGAWFSLAALAAGTVISGSFYLRMLSALWHGESAPTSASEPITAPWLAALSGLAVVALGLAPAFVTMQIVLAVR